MTILKITFKDDIRRIRMDEELTYESVLTKILDTQPEFEGNDNIQLKYKDDEGDVCTLTPFTFRDFLLLQSNGDPGKATVLKLEVHNAPVHDGQPWWKAALQQWKGKGKGKGKWKGKGKGKHSDEPWPEPCDNDREDWCLRKGKCKGKGKCDEVPKGPCARGCGFMRTWHDTHCCNACEMGKGFHGPHCAKIPVESSISPEASDGPEAALLPSAKGADSMIGNEASESDLSIQGVHPKGWGKGKGKHGKGKGKLKGWWKGKGKDKHDSDEHE